MMDVSLLFDEQIHTMLNRGIKISVPKSQTFDFLSQYCDFYLKHLTFYLKIVLSMSLLSHLTLPYVHSVWSVDFESCRKYTVLKQNYELHIT